MRRQRNMAQMKEQIKTPEEELNEMEISNLSGAELKTLVIRMIKGLCEDLSRTNILVEQTCRTSTPKLKPDYSFPILEMLTLLYNIRIYSTE